MKMKYCQFILVTETSDTALTDDAYYGWIINSYFNAYRQRSGDKGLQIRFEFVHMDGKTNYKSDEAIKEIKTRISMFKGITEVIYCFDIDNYGKKNKEFISEVRAYCDEHGYRLSFAHPEIERVFNITHGNSKVEKVKLFNKNCPKKADIPKERFFCVDDARLKVGTTTFGYVVESIINELLGSI